MRLVIARCSVDYTGRLNAHLPLATRLLVHKGDGSLLVHSDGGSYKPLNWMSPPCTLTVETPDDRMPRQPASSSCGGSRTPRPATRSWCASTRCCTTPRTSSASTPGCVKDGVEADLQRLLAEQVDVIGDGLTLVRREFPTAIGPVDLLLRDPAGGTIAVEVKRRGDIDGVEQLTRYLELLGRDPHLAPVTGVFAAQEIKPQARVLAADRGIRCVTLDYDGMKGVDSGAPRLF